jgi:hypothetical protein
VLRPIETLALAFERCEIGVLLQCAAPAGGTDDCVMALALAWQAALSDLHGGELRCV